MDMDNIDELRGKVEDMKAKGKKTSAIMLEWCKAHPEIEKMCTDDTDFMSYISTECLDPAIMLTIALTGHVEDVHLLCVTMWLRGYYRAEQEHRLAQMEKHL